MRRSLPATLLTLAVLALPASAAATTPVTQHLTDGEQLVTNLGLTGWPDQGAINTYDEDGLNSGIAWGTAGLPSGWSNDTKCARLVDDLLGHSYSWATSTWFQQQFGSLTPDTAKWVTKVEAATHVETVGTVAALQAGDIVLFDKATGTDHTVIVRQVTSLAGGITPQAGTVQYAVQVLDSTSNPHGW